MTNDVKNGAGSIEWSKFLAREFLVGLLVIILSFILALKGIMSDTVFVAACGVGAGFFIGGVTMQKRGAMKVNEALIKVTNGKALQQ